MLKKYEVVCSMFAFILVGLFQDVKAVNKYGVTWSIYSHDGPTGVDTVGCNDPGITALQIDYPGLTSVCNSEKGDTYCSRSLPILCITNKRNAKYPNTTVTAPKDWSGAHIAATPPILGYTLESAYTMTSYCIAAFGEEWRAVEFHDGGGDSLSAFGRVPYDIRFWVYINNQPGNCWGR